MRGLKSLLAVLLMLVFAPGLQAQSPPEATSSRGDRIVSAPKNLDEWIPAALPRESYRVAAGDVLAVQVTGKASLNYRVKTATTAADNADEVTVSPGGDIQIALVGNLVVAGKTADEIEGLIAERLAEYIKDFRVSVSVARIRTLNVWISGEVENAGPQILPAMSTVSLAVLQAGIKPTGSTRRVTLIRDGLRREVDLYRMAITGSVEEDIPLEPGDTVHIPAVTDYVEISGEVVRPGRYEIVRSSGASVRSLIALALGVPASAALDKAYIERIGVNEKKKAVNVNLGDSAVDIELEAGDVLVIPSISAFQPMVKLIGEFKGDGVYQRAPTLTPLTKAENVQNKSGIYFLKQGQTVLDVIAATGGVTPQADLKRARIERRSAEGKTETIPVDLEVLMVQGDKSADVALANGDSLILPAVADQVHVFGEVKNPGSYVYSPNRRLVDYIGDGGGPTQLAKLTEVSVVRGRGDTPQVHRFDSNSAMRHGNMQGNPVLEPGDIVYVPQKFVSGWRDGVQLLFTALSLSSLLNRL